MARGGGQRAAPPPPMPPSPQPLVDLALSTEAGMLVAEEAEDGAWCAEKANGRRPTTTDLALDAEPRRTPAHSEQGRPSTVRGAQRTLVGGVPTRRGWRAQQAGEEIDTEVNEHHLQILARWIADMIQAIYLEVYEHLSFILDYCRMPMESIIYAQGRKGTMLSMKRNKVAKIIFDTFCVTMEEILEVSLHTWNFLLIY